MSMLDPRSSPHDSIEASTSHVSGPSDTYGVALERGTKSMATLRHAAAPQQSAPPFHLIPQPRGAFNGLRAEPVHQDACQPGWIEVSVKAVGVNFRDVLNVLGMYPGDPGPPGGDCAGIITRVSEGLESCYKVGRSVFGLAAGSLGSYVHGSSKTLIPVPEGMTLEQAASMPTVFITVDAALRQAANIKRGERVLLHAAAGGVGLAGIQMAESLGARIFASAGSTDKRTLVRSVGVECAVGSRDTVFASDVASFDGVDVVLNSLTSTGMVSASLATLRRGGRFVEISKRDIWSTSRVSQERPDVGYSLLAVDFMDEFTLNAALHRVASGAAKGILRPLPLVMHSLGHVVAALRQMSQARHVGKIVVRSHAVSTLNSETMQQHGILITGGMGVLGSQVTEWLASQQMPNAILLGRTGRPSSSSRIVVSDDVSPLYGLHVRMVSCDSSTQEDTIHSFRTQTPLLGFLHAGGVLSDATISGQSRSRMLQVMGPKVVAALKSQGQAGLQPLQFRLLFSSIAALVGSPGQANYSAANAILDSMAEHMQYQGIVSTSIQFGAWAGAGMASNDKSTASRVERTGMALLTPAQGLSIIEGTLISIGSSCIPAVIAGNVFLWPRILQRFGKEVPFFFDEFKTLVMERSMDSISRPARPKDSFAASSKVDNKAAVQEQVADAVRSILGTEVSRTEPLMAAGLDSLGAVELKNALEGRLGLQLPGTLVFDYPTVDALSDFVTSQMVLDDAEHGGVVEATLSPKNEITPTMNNSAVALIGASSRSGRSDVILSNKPQDAITRVPLVRWDLDYLGLGNSLPAQFGAFLPDIDQFDASLFNISSTEAELMDAQQRLLLQTSMEVSLGDKFVVLHSLHSLCSSLNPSL